MDQKLVNLLTLLQNKLHSISSKCNEFEGSFAEPCKAISDLLLDTQKRDEILNVYIPVALQNASVVEAAKMCQKIRSQGGIEPDDFTESLRHLKKVLSAVNGVVDDIIENKEENIDFCNKLIGYATLFTLPYVQVDVQKLQVGKEKKKE
jgi:hypothetical protein